MVEREEQAVEEIQEEKRDDKDRRGNDPGGIAPPRKAVLLFRLFIEEKYTLKLMPKRIINTVNYTLQVGGIAS